MSVYGTSAITTNDDGFLGSKITYTIGLPVGSPYCRRSALRWADLPTHQPTAFNLLFHQQAVVSLLRDAFVYSCIAVPEYLTGCPSASPVGYALGLD